MGLFRKEPAPRLRHLLQVGAKVEAYGITFYRGLAENTGNDAVRELCLILAGEEQRHKAWIDEVLEQWGHLEMDRETGLALEKELRDRGILEKPSSSLDDEKEMITWAIDQEERMARFYQDHLDDLKAVWKKDRLEQMVREEQRHARRLKELYSS